MKHIINLEKYFHSLGKKEYIKKNYTLDDIRLALKYLSNPQNRLKNIIHITGTNGKGTVAIYTSKILHSLGYKVGLFISPHIYDVTERIQLNNKQINEKILIDYLRKVYETVPKQIFKRLTYFELLTCVMFLYFADNQPDYTVMEVGLGGKLDATNVVDNSIVSCITSISLDHTEVLGKTEFDIVKDKSAIIKPNSIFICGEVKSKIKEFLYKLCKKLNTKFVYIPKDEVNFSFVPEKWGTLCKIFSFNTEVEFSIQGCSVIQPYNLLLSLKIVENALGNNYTIVTQKLDDVVNSINKTILPCRMQRIKIGRIEAIIDGAHNPAAVRNFVLTMQKLSLRDIVICITLMKEKDYKKIFTELSLLKDIITQVIVYKLPTPRCQDTTILYNEAKKHFGNKVEKFDNIKIMLTYLLKFSKQTKIFFIGSFYSLLFLSLSFKNYE
ncbi:MAG: Mur ligase family protein [Endomicrobia bacterium]|nr:Mur ligase family protein [Endomicrobiia bacterium]MDW8055455.1 Mur ligase family protein [Elusimicrobiota bacterium]